VERGTDVAISDAQYQAWLANPEAERVLLAEVKAYSDASEVMRYLGSKYFQTGASDTPANTVYEGILKENPFFSTTMSEAFGGRSFVSIGSLLIDNGDGDKDSWITDAWDGRDATLKFGDPTWDISDFRTILSGVVERLQVSDDLTLELIIRDKQRTLDAPIQTTLISSGESTDQVVPLCYGEVFNVKPVLIDDTTHEYQVHEGQIEDIVEVYVDGKATTLTVTEDLSNGKFTLSGDPAGTVTADVKGHKPSGSYKTKPGEIIRAIVSRVLTDPDDLDTTAFTTFDTDFNYTIGTYIDIRENLLDVLDSILPAGWYYGFDRDGKFTLAELKDPSGLTSAMTIDNLESHGDLNVQKADVPEWRVRVGYKKNWKTINFGSDSTVAEDARPFFENEFLNVAKSEDATVKTTHLLAQDPDILPSTIAGYSNALTEAVRLLTLFKTQRYTYSVSAFVAPLQVTIGDCVTLKDDRFGLSAGSKTVVTGITEYLLDNKIEVELWQ
jgi:hypothetical protein